MDRLVAFFVRQTVRDHRRTSLCGNDATTVQHVTGPVMHVTPDAGIHSSALYRRIMRPGTKKFWFTVRNTF